MSKLTPFAKLTIVIAVTGTLFFGYRKAAENGLIPTPGFAKALIPEKAQLPDLKDSKLANVTPASLPVSTQATVANTLIRGAIWEWNAPLGLLLANGGAHTTTGSLNAKRNVNLFLYRQDDTNKMQEDLIACAKEIHDGAKQCSTGANFVIIMGDGQFAAAVNPQLRKLGPTYQVTAIGAVGYSRGEDAFMAPPEVKGNPNAAKGLLVSGVLRDGDWNIAMKWAADNAIKNNPDEKTYDPDALNWVNSSDYNVAAADYVAGKCEDRKVVKDGRPTGETKHVCIGATVTWTPGDVTAVQQKGGLVKVVSSKEYRSQMPATIVGPNAFFNTNRAEITQMLAAAFEGGDQVKAFEASLQKGAEISAKVYADQDGAYWAKYYKGTIETDRAGNKVELGGSAVNNLADNLILFGLLPGTNDNFRSTYTTFANIANQQYPAIFKDTPIPEVKDIEDKSFVTGAQAIMDVTTAPDTQVFIVTGMADVLASIPKVQYDLARTLRMGPWRVVWEVVVLGQADKVFDVVRQNAAIGWMSTSMIEGMAREGGGVGTLLLNSSKHFHLSAILAIQIVILTVGLGQDFAIGALRNLFCPYANLGVERK